MAVEVLRTGQLRWCQCWAWSSSARGRFDSSDLRLTPAHCHVDRSGAECSWTWRLRAEKHPGKVEDVYSSRVRTLRSCCFSWGCKNGEEACSASRGGVKQVRTCEAGHSQARLSTAVVFRSNQWRPRAGPGAYDPKVGAVLMGIPKSCPQPQM